ncbi:hypothetical protein Daus18300_013386 [Diaporthe australafricana]|uniref:Nephrocystin 3-like N-terminal domain-containing protein n=1 Tax=Diaporthe australafricana TaxID=127596 RepID=A0ABR3VZ87_9PEZI
MGALAAVSLAGNIIQFVDTAISLVTTARQLPHSSTFGAVSTQRTFYLLHGIDIGNDAGKLDTTHAVLRNRWKKDEIEALQRRLDRISRAVDLDLGFHYRCLIFARVEELAAENGRLQAHRADELRQLQNEFGEIFQGLAGDRHRAMALLIGASGRGLHIPAEQAILQQLSYVVVGQREKSIHAAHQQTLTWVFGKPEQSSPTTFEDWLSSEEDLYWVSGKPGSGKTALMEFLTYHSRTQSGLKAWAGGHPLIRAGYFFWSSSRTGLYKSQQGLLLYIIYRNLREHPELIAQVYPEVFAAGKAMPAAAVFEISASVFLLLAVLQAISLHLKESNVRFCFFINGLDEYDGSDSKTSRSPCLLSQR